MLAPSHHANANEDGGVIADKAKETMNKYGDGCCQGSAN
jgi:hypothetical protein